MKFLTESGKGIQDDLDRFDALKGSQAPYHFRSQRLYELMHIMIRDSSERFFVNAQVTTCGFGCYSDMALSLQELLVLLRIPRHLSRRLSKTLKCYQVFVFAVQLHQSLMSSAFHYLSVVKYYHWSVTGFSCHEKGRKAYHRYNQLSLLY